MFIDSAIGVSTLPHHLVGPLPSHFYINSGTLQHVPSSIRPPPELAIATTATTTTPMDKPIPITSNNVTSVTTSQVNMTEGHPNENQQQQQKMFGNNSGSNSISDRQQMQYFYG